jgi:hypothetical protein
MESKREFIKKTVDANAAIYNIGTNAESIKINPNIWDFKIRDYETANLVVAPLAEFFDFRGPGVDYKVTIDEAPSAAGLLVETDAIAVSAVSTRSVTFSPLEYGARHQVTRKEAVRAFFNLAERMSRKLGYALFLKKDALAVSTLQAGTNLIFANARAVATDLVASDKMTPSLIAEGTKTMENLYYTPKALIMNYYQKNDLLNTTTITDVSKFGTRSAIEKGVFGEIFGVQLVVSHSIPVASHVAKAIMLGETGSGEKAFGYAIKRDPMVETQYDAIFRVWDIVAHEEYDFKILHQGAVCMLGTYVA